MLISAGFLAMLFVAHEEQVTRWGREVDDETADPTGFGVRTGAVRGSALTIGATATAMALALPLLVPTLDVTLFDGAGPGQREIEVADPMVDLRRDLSRGQDIPLRLRDHARRAPDVPPARGADPLQRRHVDAG